LSAQLLESELFGHVRGAFTDAVRDNPGRIAGCEGGTLFLDEIGELPLQLQPKLLRFIQDRQYERVGDTTTRHADVRILTATNAQLEQAVREKRFREDLFYRINVIQIELPPLRDRPADILPLARTLLAHFGRERKVGPLSDEAAAALQMYNWPGNVRELRNVIERGAILCNGGPIELRHLPVGLLGQRAAGIEPQLGDPVAFDRSRPHPPAHRAQPIPRRRRQVARHRCRHPLAQAEKIWHLSAIPTAQCRIAPAHDTRSSHRTSARFFQV
jgi:NtrC-family two-component system response regulator AlgB